LVSYLKGYKNCLLSNEYQQLDSINLTDQLNKKEQAIVCCYHNLSNYY